MIRDWKVFTCKILGNEKKEQFILKYSYVSERLIKYAVYFFNHF